MVGPRLLRTGAKPSARRAGNRHSPWRPPARDAGRTDGTPRNRPVDGGRDPRALAWPALPDPRRQRQARARAGVPGGGGARLHGWREAALGACTRLHAAGTRRGIHAGDHGSRGHGLHSVATILRALPAGGRLRCIGRRTRRGDPRCPAPRTATPARDSHGYCTVGRPGAARATSAARDLGRTLGATRVS